MNKYLEESDMCSNATWATDIEIVAISSLLNTPVFIHTRLPSGEEKWLKYGPVCVVPPTLKGHLFDQLLRTLQQSCFCVVIVFRICMHCCGGTPRESLVGVVNLRLN